MSAPRAACIGPVLMTFAAMAVLLYIAGRNYYDLHTERYEETTDSDNNTSVKRREISRKPLEHHRETKSSVCRSPECLDVAKHIRGSLNMDINPCEDFYNFACGNWKKHNPLPKSYNDFNTFSKLSHHIERELRGLLEDNIKIGSRTIEQASVRKAKHFYKSCMDVEEIERLGALPMLNFIESIGSWAVAGKKKWQARRWNIYKVLKHIQKLYYPASPFFSVEVTNDHLNSTRHLIKIEQSGLSLQREIYFKHPEMVKIYEDYMAKVAVLLGAKPEVAKLQMKQVMKFETNLAYITASAEDKAEGLYRRMKIKELIHRVPQFPWLQHLKYIFPDAHVSKTDVVLATSPKYLRNIAKIIKHTRKKLLSNYITWQMVREKVGLLSRPFRKARSDFNNKITGVKDVEDRWRTCTSITNDNMGVPIGSLYIKKYFDDSRVNTTMVMIGKILDVFKRRVTNHDWIDNKTTEGILDKANAVFSKVGYAPYIKNPRSLRKRFKSLEVDPKRFFWNNVNVDKWVRKRLFAKLRKTVDAEKWPMFPQTINAMYQFYENEIVIPAGILRPPFYYTGNVPRSLTYGAIGSIIGHELTHGFDNTGRRFDKNGNIISEWWQASALKEFDKRAKCIEKQYSKYKIQSKYPLNGKITLGENIADNGGTKLSYYAYKNWLKENGVERSLPGVPFNNEQLFFIGYAQEYCGVSNPKTEYISALSEVHAPPRFRVIGTLSNSSPFSKAFNCKAGSPMNPKKKCEVW
ncbi:endothelin-converting enzyme 2-like isoform X2 [Dendronephthya gigantea]|uniref:endothelin-converting enzyme 2-like isoform X2 n=1 Tax=Dendronephthya gigantea TaxID=151771 RepID=UPI00106A0983|nr:endothelin-converting enzyme 2-like isoform X2 [Dendronephthya gigantea]